MPGVFDGMIFGSSRTDVGKGSRGEGKAGSQENLVVLAANFGGTGLRGDSGTEANSRLPF